MANHLEDLTAEWLEYNGYFVRKSVLVGKRPNGGFEGELDVVGFNPLSEHLIHIECSLDADTWERREERFALKFKRGRKYIFELFHGIAAEKSLDQVAVFGLGGGGRTQVGGGRIIWVADLTSDILDALRTKHPAKAAVPSTLPLLRTLQLAAHAKRKSINGSPLFALT